MVKLQQLSPDDWRLWRIVRLQALEEAPYAFGTSLSDWQGEGDRESRWRNRLDDVPFNVVAAVDGRPVGQVSGTELDDRLSVELISMWVAPISRGTGIGEALIDAVVGWAEGIGAQGVSLAVKDANSHAIALYKRAGFVDRGVSADTPDERTMTRLLARLSPAFVRPVRRLGSSPENYVSCVKPLRDRRPGGSRSGPSP